MCFPQLPPPRNSKMIRPVLVPFRDSNGSRTAFLAANEYSNAHLSDIVQMTTAAMVAMEESKLPLSLRDY